MPEEMFGSICNLLSSHVSIYFDICVTRRRTTKSEH